MTRRSLFLSVAAIPALAPLAGAAGVTPPCVDIPEGWSIASFGGRTSFPTKKKIADVYFCDPLAHEFRVAQVRMSSLPKLAGYPVRVCHTHVYRSLRIRQAFGRRDPVSFGDMPKDAYKNTYKDHTRPVTSRATMDQVQGWTRIRANERFGDRNSNGAVSEWEQALFVNPTNGLDIRAVRIPREARH